MTIPLHNHVYQLFRSIEEGVASRMTARGWPRLGRAQMTAMLALAEDSTSMAQLARRLGVSRQAVHQTVKQLDAWNYVVRQSEARVDGTQIVRLTPAGRHLGIDLTDAIEETEKALEETLGVGRMWALKKVFTHLDTTDMDLGSP
jgi:DNA-binding MarR family transcriptional regulator